MIITIDGKVATGKSTVAKRLAEKIGYVYFDTGAMYRSFTYYLIKHNLDFHDPEILKKALHDFKFKVEQEGKEKRYLLEGEDITDKIRSREVTGLVAEVAAIEEVREQLVHWQRKASEGIDVVFEGRDLGSVVFPKAKCKIFLTGRDEVRAKRRLDEIKEKYPEQAKGLSMDKMLEEVRERDHIDTTREHSPLKAAPDAHIVDTSDLTIDGVVQAIIDLL